METLRASFLLTAGVLVACSSQQAEWAKANGQGTVTAHHEFLKHHPDSAHAELARGRILSLEDAQAWTVARSANTPEAFEQYLQNLFSCCQSKGHRWCSLRVTRTTLC